MKKTMIRMLSLFLVLCLVTGCGSDNETKNEKKEETTKKSIKVDGKKYSFDIDASQYGSIEVGSVKFDMLTTEEKLEELGLDDGSMMDLYDFEDKETDSYFLYETMNFDDSYEVEFLTYNDYYSKKDCSSCDDYQSSYVKLPKNITYDSTMDEVIKAYGEGKKTEYSDQFAEYHKDSNGEYIGKLPSTQLNYSYKKDNVEFYMELSFDKDTEKLYRVEYRIQVYDENID